MFFFKVLKTLIKEIAPRSGENLRFLGDFKGFLVIFKGFGVFLRVFGKS